MLAALFTLALSLERSLTHTRIFLRIFTATNCCCHWSGKMRKNLKWNATKWYIKSDRGRTAERASAQLSSTRNNFRGNVSNKRQKQKTLHYVKFFSLCVCVRARKNCCCGVGAGQSRPVFDTMRQQQQPVRRHQDESSPVGLGSQSASQPVSLDQPGLANNLFSPLTL